MVGVLAATIMLYVVALAGWAEKSLMDPICLLIHNHGWFFTWEFGFIGIQRKNNRFARFEKALKNGKHIFFVDIEPENDQLLADVVKRHLKLNALVTDHRCPNGIFGCRMVLNHSPR